MAGASRESLPSSCSIVLRNKFSEDTLVAHLRSIVADPQRSNTASGAFSDASLKGDLALHDELVFYPPWKATAKRLATYPLMLAMIVGLVSLLGWVYVGGLFYDYDTVKARLVQGTVDEAQWQEQVPEEQYYVLIGVANGIAIPILNVVYKKIAVALTEWELHRTHNAFNEALALKLFMFQFVNSYASLFFIAFWSRSFHRLQFQLFFIMFVGQCTQNFVELGVPAFLSKLHLVGWSRAAASSFQGAPPTEESQTKDKSLPPPEPNRCTAPDMCTKLTSSIGYNLSRFDYLFNRNLTFSRCKFWSIFFIFFQQ